MPFHKLSQWLAYSLLEPFEWSGVRVTGLDALTGLPEYRNGGLLIDAGVLRPLPADWATRHWQAGDAFIVEWRALTVALLDELAPLVRAELGLSAEQMPLACVLEGGTWGAGRLLAQRLRNGLPPLNIVSARRFRFRLTTKAQPWSNVTLVDHPLVQHKLTLMRRKDASTNSFRRMLNELSLLMAYEVTRDMPMQDIEIETPLETMTAKVIDGKKLVFVSILRAGNGILEGMLNVVPARAATSASTATRRR
jgi:hypothetical protein